MKYLSELEKRGKNWGNCCLQRAIWNLPAAVADSGGWQGWLVNAPERIKKNSALFRSRSLFVISIFQFRYDVKYKSIPSKFERLYNIYMCLFQCLVTCKDHCIILQAILSVALKANTSNIAQALKNICIFLERSVPSESHFNILQNSTLKPHWLYLETCATICPCAK